jgi:hypothetical protein
MQTEAQPQNRKPLRRPIPWLVRVPYTLFVAVLVFYYWNFYGPANFLWLCDLALLLTMLALWLESPFLASMQLVAVFVPAVLWLTDFFARLLTGSQLSGMTVYMFRQDIPLVIRALSLYHGWLPFLLLWLVARLGYDRRGWLAESVLALVVLPFCYIFTDPIRNLNAVFGLSSDHPQRWMAPGIFLLVMMAVYPLLVFLPAHLLFRYVFRERRALC